MKTKPDIKKIIANIKLDKKVEKKELNPKRDGMRITIDYTKPLHRERDMRQEALDMGSHDAKEFFGGQDAGTI